MRLAYRQAISAHKLVTDKEGNLIYLYTTNANDQYSYIQAAKDKAYSVLIMDGQLDVHAISQMEQKFEKTRFVRVDSDTIDNLIRKDDVNKVTLNEDEKNALQEMFKSQLPKIEKTDFIVTFEALGETQNPVMLTPKRIICAVCAKCLPCNQVCRFMENCRITTIWC